MPLRKTTITQTASGTWAADTTIPTDISRVGLITELKVLVEVTPSATLTAANQPDGLFRVVQNLRIRGGSHTYIELPGDDGCMGGVLLHYLSMVDGYGPGHQAGAITAPQTTYTPMMFVIHPGSRPRWHGGYQNPYDLSAFIPAGHEQQLIAEWVVSGGDVMDDGVTISSAVARYIISRVLGTEGDIQAEMRAQGVSLPPIPGIRGMIPAWTSVVHANAGTTTSVEGETVDIPTGQFLKRLAMLVQDATGDRPVKASDEITEVAHLLRQSNEELFHYNTEASLLTLPYGSHLTINSGSLESAGTEKMGADFNGHAPQAIFIHDYRQHAQNPWTRDYGLDLRGAKNGDHQLGFIITTRAAGDDALILYERLGPYYGPLGG